MQLVGAASESAAIVRVSDFAGATPAPHVQAIRMGSSSESCLLCVPGFHFSLECVVYALPVPDHRFVLRLLVWYRVVHFSVAVL